MLNRVPCPSPPEVKLRNVPRPLVKLLLLSWKPVGKLKEESEDASSALCETISVEATVAGRRKGIQSWQKA